MTSTLNAPPVDAASDAAAEPDPDTGKLFDVPRARVFIDDTDPDTIKLGISGTIALDRSDAEAVALFNSLREGRDIDLDVTAHVAAGKTTHHRDKDGHVDEVIRTKTLIVHTVNA